MSPDPAEAQDAARPHLSPARVLDIDSLLDDRQTRIVVCCGSGGVGKTTTAAALGLRAAERGRKVVVLTIDPARRLAQSMGIDSLDNVPRRVKGTEDRGGASRTDSADGDGGRQAGGELHAMMLDMKRTFDEVVEAHADPERAAAILANPFYQSLSAGFAGTQEYMAMEKLGQLRARDEWDLIVVDTPPSRSALDFLDAPKRLGSFLDGRLIRLLTAPAKLGGRAGMAFLNVGMSMMTGTLGKLLGGQLLKDVQTFVAAMDTTFGGFRTRADATYKLLQAPGTAFLVVAAPERDALREAAYFVERLAAEDMPLVGLVLNRVHGSGAGRLSAERALAAAETLDLAGDPASENLEEPRIVDQGGGKAGLRNSPDTYDSSEPPASVTPAPDDGSPAATDDDSPATDPERTVDQLTAGLLRLHADRMQLLSREQRTRDRFAARHPEVAVVEVPALPGDVHDLAGLRDIGDRLAAGRTELP
ncbi:anion-transporting ArsA/GET3 family ATPase [Streptomyces griseochromogenes]|uniref:Anion-transporting ATPase n=1 Tax=Streptomyces griseochromogenes TaxID=68214 RepID=A0A1B1APS8_9ACTN|nr:ArsA family ATPase [Streptomyces griseochromogenes]ANP48554.1 anion-transporting ATPase [Streptomyces griseochromogenes]MBP2056173.1 anion-transporting ArsA/GET3 family ATPase [Streptomyces griseochromogenes]